MSILPRTTVGGARIPLMMQHGRLENLDLLISIEPLEKSRCTRDISQTTGRETSSDIQTAFKDRHDGPKGNSRLHMTG